MDVKSTQAQAASLATFAFEDLSALSANQRIRWRCSRSSGRPTVAAHNHFATRDKKL